ncbi:uncharacterized protein I303_100668 [Kwoniella dejecticola CBS 10117]|uniref:Peptidase M20 dimerisation domain-containing protein n=1 Tax=Kwoniella dejecticola CBS 10117 TaxID=1296121 RepID=A0AAJ8MEC0_9TREE
MQATNDNVVSSMSRAICLIPLALFIAILFATQDRRDKLSAIIGIIRSGTPFLNVSEGAQTHSHICRHALQRNGARTSPVHCPVQPKSLSQGPEWDPAADEGFLRLSHQRLAGAVQIRTESFDDMPYNSSDPRFHEFTRLEAYLKNTYSNFHAHMQFERVNEHGLLFTWKGSNLSLKPMLLMAHQDVVPVNPHTWNQWTYPPFSGHLDEQGWIWGRGTTDMKGTLVAILAATERALSEDFKPERTVLFSFGFDEEIGGERGANELAKVIHKRYGTDGISLIVDEGFTGVDVEYDTSFARLGVAEKGCLTVTIDVSTPGGHSSRPPRHTGVGVMSRLLVEMENNPNMPQLKEGNPLLSYLECAAEYGNMEDNLKKMVREEKCWPALAEQMGDDRILQTFLKTTQAVDIVNGGIKYNALPEYVTSMTNYRIDFFETTQDTFSRLEKILRPIADEYNMTFIPYGEDSDVHQNVIRLDTFGIVLEPAPLTPAIGPAWDLMGGTIRSLFPNAIVVPSAMTAFTDTQHFWDVSKNIYRFVPASLQMILNYHMVDERIHIDAHISTIKFYHRLIWNSAGWASP